jgi:hypothetical protein
MYDPAHLPKKILEIQQMQSWRRLSMFVAIVVVACLAIVMASLVSVAGQQNSAPAAAYRAPRTKDGKPDLNGIWEAMNTANFDIAPHNASSAPLKIEAVIGALAATPPGLGIVEGGILPYLPAALKQRKENFEKRFAEDPEAKCYLPGVPRFMYMPYPFQIIQSTDHIAMVSEYKGALRDVYMNSTKKAPADSWMGWSNGKWDGETLVIDTTGFNDRSWFDRSGDFHSEDLHVVERITAGSPYHLNYEATIEDPQVFSKPFKISMPLYRRMEKNIEIQEYRCVEYSEELIYGKYRKVPLQ